MRLVLLLGVPIPTPLLSVQIQGKQSLVCWRVARK
ncbi:hypothetical protein VSP9026_03926 [Vibrio spartinae]|uniref:Uncharacterized protein n=1 Tax=Vibrio spartinae TaxID=1918945 RepID=A0A1N6M9N4_9VIBR|nr:hypothetical protein VSP9026_03926 [Vibrio spartinae]